MQHPKPLKEKVRFTLFTHSNLPLPSFAQVSQGMLGLGVETHPETDRKRNQAQCRLGKVVVEISDRIRKSWEEKEEANWKHFKQTLVLHLF